jgi:hypothetical protein
MRLVSRTYNNKEDLTMATNKIHALALLVAAQDCTEFCDCNIEDATVVTLNDSMRCWSGAREYSHFTINPETGMVSWMQMPTEDVSEWTEELVKSAERFSAGKPGEACVDEATVCSEFWRHNKFSKQNMLMYLHLVQDRIYDRFVRTVIDTSRRYEDVFIFNGKAYTGNDLRGKGMMRWNGDGLINILDAQFYVRLAKRYYEATGILANATWIEQVFKPAFFRTYSQELAEKTVKYVSINHFAEEVINNMSWDEETWPVPNWLVDQFIEWMIDDMVEAVLSFAQ